MNEGMAEIDAEVLSQRYNIIAMAIFVTSRFICTYFLKYINAGALLGILAAVGACLTLGVIFFKKAHGVAAVRGDFFQRREELEKKFSRHHICSFAAA